MATGAKENNASVALVSDEGFILARSPFEAPRRLVTGTTGSRTPLDALDGIITPADLHYERHHAGVPTIDPAAHTLTVHGMVDRPTVFTLADLQRFIDMGPPPNMFNHNISQAKANLYLGELSAIIAAHDKRDDGYDRALAQLALAESTAKQVGDSATAEAAVASRTVVADFRAGRITTMQAVASNDPGKRYGSFAEAVSAVAGGSAAPVAPAAEDTGARFRRFSAVYAQRENDYKPKVVALQEALKAQQPGADSAQACQALATMDASYQAMKAAFVPMRQMKDQGELANQPDLVQKLEARDAQQNKVQASIDGTRTRLGCK